VNDNAPVEPLEMDALPSGPYRMKLDAAE